MNKKGKAKSSSLNNDAERKKVGDSVERYLHHLGERIKELNCLYGISDLVERPGISIYEMVQGIVELIPPAWQYPEVTCAQITLKDKKFRTENFRKTKWKQTSDVVVKGEKRGAIEVYYLKKMPTHDDGPFLDEERNLIYAISERLGRIIERREAEEELKKYRLHLEELVTERTLKLETEIVERKRMEKALHTATEEWELTFNTMSDGVSIHSADRTIVRANKSLGKLLGSSPEKLVGRKCYHAFHHCKGPIKDCPMEQCTLSKGTEYVEVFEPSINSWLSISLTPLSKDGGDVVEFVHVARDITERKQVEDAIAESEALYHDLVETSQNLIWRCDEKGRFTFLNHAWTKTHGYKTKEMMGRPFSDFQTPEVAARDIREFQKHMAGGAITGYETTQISKEGKEVHLLFNAIPLYDAAGSIVGTQGTAYDITDRKRAEEELHRLNEHLEELVEERTHELALASEELIRKEKLATLGQLSGSIAHEIRNPLGVIGNSVYYLKMKLGGADAKVRRHLDILQGEVLRTNAIISDLLDFSKTRAPFLTRWDLNGIITDVLEEAELPESVTLKTRFDSHLPSTMMDKDQVRQAFLNLISNAIQAMPDGGTLKITTTVKDGFVEVKVSDSGDGIPGENLKKIFEPLFTTKSRGTGLGLAIVKGIIDKHKGQIEVESMAGEGTTFTVRLPVTGDGAS